MLLCCATNKPTGINQSAEDVASHSDTPEQSTEHLFLSAAYLICTLLAEDKKQKTVYHLQQQKTTHSEAVYTTSILCAPLRQRHFFLLAHRQTQLDLPSSRSRCPYPSP